jgi:hypothetical protein
MKPENDASKSTIIDYKKVNFSIQFKSGHFSQQSLTGN